MLREREAVDTKLLNTELMQLVTPYANSSCHSKHTPALHRHLFHNNYVTCQLNADTLHWRRHFILTPPLHQLHHMPRTDLKVICNGFSHKSSATVEMGHRGHNRHRLKKRRGCLQGAGTDNWQVQIDAGELLKTRASAEPDDFCLSVIQFQPTRRTPVLDGSNAPLHRLLGLMCFRNWSTCK